MNSYLIRLELPLRELHGWARHHSLTVDDTGYLVHLALRGAFGMLAPQPFAVDDRPREGFLEVLGYAAEPGQKLLEYHRAVTDPLLHAVVPPDRLRDKRMPDAWQAGVRYRFRVLCCPVKRCRDEQDRVCERDAFLSACIRDPENRELSREEIYRGWLDEQLSREGAARLLDCRISGYRLVKPVRRGKRENGRGAPPGASRDCGRKCWPRAGWRWPTRGLSPR